MHAGAITTNSGIVISWYDYLALGALTFLVVGVLTPIARRAAIRLEIWDAPIAAHKTHKEPTPYLGGVAIAIGIMGVSYLSLIAKGGKVSEFGLLTSVLAPAFILGIIGLLDDMKNLRPLPRFIAQTISGIVISVILILTSNVGTPTGNEFLDGALTTLWVVGITNSINFFDNLDGGAAGTVALSSIGLAIISYMGSQYFIAAMASVVAGACIGFLLWNKSPARIYMGDAGALFLGVLMAALTVRLHPSAQTKWTSFATPILLLATPILDTSVAVSSRIRRKVSPFQGGRDHLSHRLMRLGLSRPIAAISLWALSALFDFFAILIPIIPMKAEEITTAFAALLWIALYLFFIWQADS
jgi:UDP-GlcNAc:undecaprenyl-phosphate/decaprenyl-phosphate GlcNAc-1-phosphate transferase